MKCHILKIVFILKKNIVIAEIFLFYAISLIDNSLIILELQFASEFKCSVFWCFSQKYEFMIANLKHSKHESILSVGGGDFNFIGRNHRNTQSSQLFVFICAVPWNIMHYFSSWVVSSYALERMRMYIFPVFQSHSRRTSKNR